jgi:hypothetical protein
MVERERAVKELEERERKAGKIKKKKHEDSEKK